MGNVSKWIFGMNMYQSYGLNNEYTGNYTIGRLGGNAQTRFDYIAKDNGQRVLDILDVHYYPAASGASMDCDENDATKVANRLQAPRSLYDPAYTDPSWINTEIALIPRFQGYIDS